MAATISKLFDHIILFHIKPFLSTSDHQFGFRRDTGTDMCIFLLKQIISSYLQQGGPSFSVFLDASKAVFFKLFSSRPILHSQIFSRPLKKGLHLKSISDSAIFPPTSRCSLKKKKKGLCNCNCNCAWSSSKHVLD